MTSIPQLRKDIAHLQDKVKNLSLELQQEREKPVQIKEVVKEVPREIIKYVTKEVPIQKVKVVTVKDDAEIDRLKKDISDLKNKLFKEVSKPPVVKTVVIKEPVEVIKFVDREGKVPSIKVVEKEVKGPKEVVTKEIERIVYKDNPKHIEMINKLKDMLNAN